jgi:hypothetical protein
MLFGLHECHVQQQLGDAVSFEPRAHEGNWQPQRNRDFREMSPISSRQHIFRLAGAHYVRLVAHII